MLVEGFLLQLLEVCVLILVKLAEEPFLVNVCVGFVARVQEFLKFAVFIRRRALHPWGSVPVTVRCDHSLRINATAYRPFWFFVLRVVFNARLLVAGQDNRKVSLELSEFEVLLGEGGCGILNVKDTVLLIFCEESHPFEFVQITSATLQFLSHLLLSNVSFIALFFVTNLG